MNQITNKIYNEMKSEFENLAECHFDDSSYMAIKLKAIAYQIAKLQKLCDDAKKQAFVYTASGQALKYHGELKGVNKKEALTSSGKISFSRNTPAPEDIFIPKGTIVTGSEIANLSFITDIDSNIKMGQQVAVVPAHSIQKGRGTNIAKNKINIMVTQLVGVDKVFNSLPFTGGADAESDEDYRKRVIDGYRLIPNGMSIDYFKTAVLKLTDVQYAKVSYLEQTMLMSIFVQNIKKDISTEEINIIKDKLEEIRPLNINMTVLPATVKNIDIKVRLTVADMNNRADINSKVHPIINQYIGELGIGESIKETVLASRILQIDGIKDISFDQPVFPLSVATNEILKLNSSNVVFEREK